MLDTEPLYKAAWQQAAAELGFDLDDQSYARLIGRPTPDCERELMHHFGSEFPLSRFRARWPELWRSSVSDRGIPTKAGLFAFLSFLEEQALSSAVATSSDGVYAEFSLRSAGIVGRFDAVVTGDQITRGKPAPDIYLEAAVRLGRDPAECIALEDSDAGVLAASARHGDAVRTRSEATLGGRCARGIMRAQLTGRSARMDRRKAGESSSGQLAVSWPGSLALPKNGARRSWNRVTLTL